MKFPLTLCIALALFFPSLCRADSPDEDVIKQYRAYVAAVRAGDAELMQKLVVPVSKPLQPVQAALIQLNILHERLYRQTVAQFGHIDFKKEELWDGFGQPSDEDLKDVRVKIHEKLDIAQVMLKNPQTGNHDRTTLIVRRDNKWFVPITLQLSEDEINLREPEAEEREGMLQHATRMNAEIEKILDRLQKKQFKSSAQVMRALLDTMPANGEIDK